MYRRTLSRILFTTVAFLALVTVSKAFGQTPFFADWKTAIDNHEARISALEAKVNTLPAPVKSAVSVSRSHWTHPDTISNHLQSVQHADEVAAMGISLAGMSQEQMLTLHDQLHEARSVKPVAARTVVKATTTTSTSERCPNGRCPVNASTRSVTRSKAGWYLGKNLGL